MASTDKANWGVSRIDSSGVYHGPNTYGNYTVIVSPDPDNTPAENGAILVAKTNEIKLLALEMSDNIESPDPSLVSFDWFKPTLVIESGNYDVSATGWDPSGLINDQSYPNGRSEGFNIMGPTNPNLGLETDFDTGGYLPAIGTGNPQVWITGDVTFDPGYRQNIVGLLFDGDVDAGASCQFEGCWFRGAFESTLSVGNICQGCRFDSPILTTSTCNTTFISCLLTSDTTGSFNGSMIGSAQNLYFKDCTMLGSGMFTAPVPSTAALNIIFENCTINADGLFIIPTQPVFVSFGDTIFKFRNCAFLNTGTTGWWDGYDVGNGPQNNEFIRCEGVHPNQATQASRIVLCMDKDNTLMTNK